jgi:arylsulfatase A
MKLHLYDGGMRVAGLLRYPPRVKPGQTVSTPVCSLDLLPTICELSGVPLPTGRVLDGTSIVPLLDGRTIERQTPLYWHYFRSIGAPKAAMRVGDWMILGHWDGPQLDSGASVHQGDCEAIKAAKLVKFELYDLKDDLGQTTDLAEREPARLKELTALFVKKYEQVRDEGPVWDVPPDQPKGKKK